MKSVSYDWQKLLESESTRLEKGLLDCFQQLAHEAAKTRESEMKRYADLELSLPDGDLREATEARLRAILRLEDPATGHIVSSYNDAVDSLPAAAALRRTAFAQTLALKLDPRDEERLRSLNPRIFPEALPSSRDASVLGRDVNLDAEASGHGGSRLGGRKWWQFWRG